MKRPKHKIFKRQIDLIRHAVRRVITRQVIELREQREETLAQLKKTNFLEWASAAISVGENEMIKTKVKCTNCGIEYDVCLDNDYCTIECPRCQNKNYDIIDPSYQERPWKISSGCINPPKKNKVSDRNQGA